MDLCKSLRPAIAHFHRMTRHLRCSFSSAAAAAQLSSGQLQLIAGQAHIHTRNRPIKSNNLGGDALRSNQTKSDFGSE